MLWLSSGYLLDAFNEISDYFTDLFFSFVNDDDIQRKVSALEYHVFTIM